MPNLFAIPVSLAHQDCKTVNLSLHVRIGSASSLTSSHGPPYPKEPEYVAVNLYRDFTYFDNNQGGDSQSQAQSTNNENSLSQSQDCQWKRKTIKPFALTFERKVMK